MTNQAKSIFGFYERPDQTEPSYDPGPDALCPICLTELGYPARQVRTVSLMKADNPAKSFFYRMHLDCAKNATEEEIMQVESSAIDSEAA